jgi:predicted amidohydrolase
MLQDVARCCKMLQDVAKLEVIMSCLLSSFGVPLKDVIKAVSAAASKSSGAFCSYTQVETIRI